MQEAIIQSFESTDNLFTKHEIQRQSLAPNRPLAKSFTEIGQLLAHAHPNQEDTISFFAAQLYRFIETQIHLFPENIFWDYTAFCHYIFKESFKSASSPQHQIKFHFDKVVALLKQFGKGSRINFRYMHDFLYGYDWAKWVKKSPQERQYVHPFSITFLNYLSQRGEELEALIEQNDKKYHQIEEGVYRNPFIFSRAPKDETRLLRSLATDGLIPITCWECEANPNWKLPFAELRKQRSEKLSIAKNKQQKTTTSS